MKKGLLLPLALTAALACATPHKKGPEKIHEDIDTTMNDGKEKIGEVMSSKKDQSDGQGSSYPRIVKPPDLEIDPEVDRKWQEQKEQDAKKTKAYPEAKLQQEKEAFLKRYEPAMSKTDEPLRSAAEMEQMVGKVVDCVNKYKNYSADAPLSEDLNDSWSCLPSLQPFSLPVASQIDTKIKQIIYCENDLEKQLRLKDYSLYACNKLINIWLHEETTISPFDFKENWFNDEEADGTVNQVYENYYEARDFSGIKREYENQKGGGYIEINRQTKFDSPEKLAAAPMHVKNPELADEMTRKYGGALRETVAYCDKLDKYEKMSHPEIFKLISKLEQKYGFKINYDRSAFAYDTFQKDGSDIVGVYALPNLQTMEAQLALLPTSLVRKFGPKNINLVKDLSYGLRGLKDDKSPVIDYHSAYDPKTDSVEIDLFDQDQNENILPVVFWAMDVNSRKAKGISDNLVFTGKNPAFAEINNSRNNDYEYRHFSGTNTESKALAMRLNLFFHDDRIVEQRKIEPWPDKFRLIMEAISGARFDQDKGKFFGMYSPEEYKQKFGTDPQFFADWLRGTGLDHHYWNKLLRREKFKADELMNVKKSK